MNLKKRVFCFLPSVLCGLIIMGFFSGCSGPAEPPTRGRRLNPTLSPKALEHLTKGQRFLRDQKLDEALKEFQEMARLEPKVSHTHFWVGRVHFLQKKYDKAEASLKTGLELEPDNYHALAMLGKIYSYDKQKLGQAQAMLEKALEISPDYPEARFDLARVYALKNEPKKALAEFNQLFSREPEFALYHYEMGRMLEAGGDKMKALQYYQRAHMLNPRLDAARQAVQRLTAQAQQKHGAKPETPVKPEKAPKKSAPQPGGKP